MICTAWIESHTELRDHPKVKELARLMNWDYCHTLGHLHYFWLWCLQYALDGDLRKYNDVQVANAAGVAAENAKAFIEAMINCGSGVNKEGNKTVSGFIDRTPYFRVHDWWEYAGRYIQGKFGREPEQWQYIKSLYANCLLTVSKMLDVPTNQPNQPNQPNQKKKIAPPPTLEEVKNYVAEKNLSIDPVAFFNHYEANGWVQGHRGKPIVKWQAACYTWLKNQKKFGNNDNDSEREKKLIELRSRGYK